MYVSRCTGVSCVWCTSMNLRWYVQPIGNAHGAGLGVPVNGTDSLSASCGRCVHVWMPEDSAKVMFAWSHNDRVCRSRAMYASG